MHDKRRLNRLPVSRQSRFGRVWLLRSLAARYRISLRGGFRKLPRMRIDLPQLYSRPKATKAHPGLPFAIKHYVWVDRVEIILRLRLKYQPLVPPLIIRPRGIERFIGSQRNPGNIQPKTRVCVIEVKSPIEVG